MSENKKVHVVADGILEEDNHLPNWWLATFFGSIIFAYGYWQYYHVMKAGDLPGQEYAAFKKAAQDRALAEKAAPAGSGDAKPQLTAAALLAATSGPDVAAGSALFAANCAVCHGNLGEGKVGPNLTDKFWVHGGEPLDIHSSINTGWPLKGMLAWGPVLGSEKVRLLTVYVLTLKDKNVSGKAPEGTEAGAPAAAASGAGTSTSAP